MFERFRQVPLFADLADDDLARICAEAQDVRLAPGDVLFREGDPGDRAFVVTAGQVEVLRDTDRREVLLAVRGEGEVIGEMALLQEEPRSATVRARTATDLISIPKAALDDLLQTSPSASRSVFQTLLRRMREDHDLMRHQERMVQLGTLTAGVAHELNNPAAAVARAAEHLGGELDRFTGWLAGRGGPAAALELLRDRPRAARSPVEVSDEEAAVEDWLAARGIGDAWTVAPALVDAGLGVAELGRLEQGRPEQGRPGEDADLGDTVRFLAAAAAIRRSAAEIAEGATRLSEIVRVLRSYSYLDRAPVQKVDVIRGIEDTLVLLSHATKNVRIVREYDPDLPDITASGGELNQVWTNLIHNACDALAAVEDPTLTVRALRDGDDVVVEVEDNGPGIPAEAQRRVFDAFYTTKPPGKGTGLGLQISYRIVVLEHRGDLTLRSQLGRTTFRAVIPIQAPAPADRSEESDPMTAAPCEHLEAVENTPKPEGGCLDCLAAGDTWVHLRFCVTCGRVGCCDDSKNRHATKHAAAAGHPVLRTKEPGENWAWCVEHEVSLTLGEPLRRRPGPPRLA
jgi:signal transduction histidine kinase